MTDFLTHFRTSLISISGASIGTILNFEQEIYTINTAFQHAAWTVAIIAGIVSIINGTKNWFIKRKRKSNEKK